MRKTVLKITLTDKGTEVEMKDAGLAALSVSDIVWHGVKDNNMAALNMLLACVTHTVGRDLSGDMEGKFIENIKKLTPGIREAWGSINEQFKQKQS